MEGGTMDGAVSPEEEEEMADVETRSADQESCARCTDVLKPQNLSERAGSSTLPMLLLVMSARERFSTFK
jgi:hypothetical protein